LGSNARSQIIPVSPIIAALSGLSLVVYVIIASGAAQVAHTMLLIGWWLLPIALLHLLPLSFSALSWRELLHAVSRPDTASIFRIRWIRESINSLLPVAGVGGDFASARLAHLQGVPGAQAAASMVVDITVGAATQVIFVMAGMGLLLMRSGERGAHVVAYAVLTGAVVFLAAITAFLVLQHRGLFAGSAKFARRLLPEHWLTAFAAGASAIDDAVVAAYRSGRRILRANILRFIGWAAGAGEVWLVLQILGQPFGITDALILESLESGVRVAAFMVPGALGALEGSFVLFGSLFGLPPEAALAIPLSKRARELALGVPGLFFWHWIEGCYFLRSGGPRHAARTTSSDADLPLRGIAG
jgi:putative membrane protein